MPTSINQEEYRAKCIDFGEAWLHEDQEWWRRFLLEPRGLRLMRHLMLVEQTETVNVASCDLTTDEGRMRAIKQQGKMMGMMTAIGALLDLTEVYD